MKLPRPLRPDRWNFRCRVIALDYFRNLPLGWRTLELGIFSLRPDIPEGADRFYYVERGFWWRIDYWLPFVWRSR